MGSGKQQGNTQFKNQEVTSTVGLTGPVFSSAESRVSAAFAYTENAKEVRFSQWLLHKQEKGTGCWPHAQRYWSRAGGVAGAHRQAGGGEGGLLGDLRKSRNTVAPLPVRPPLTPHNPRQSARQTSPSPLPVTWPLSQPCRHPSSAGQLAALRGPQRSAPWRPQQDGRLRSTQGPGSRPRLVLGRGRSLAWQ